MVAVVMVQHTMKPAMEGGRVGLDGWTGSWPVSLSADGVGRADPGHPLPLPLPEQRKREGKQQGGRLPTWGCPRVWFWARLPLPHR